MALMARTLINLDPKDKDWLDREAKARAVPMTELVRQAVRAFRTREENLGDTDLQSVIRETAGIWTVGDALDYQCRMRDEWDEQ
jgi:hypothetical protein